MQHYEPAKPASRSRLKLLLLALLALIGAGAVFLVGGLIAISLVARPIKIEGQAMMPALHNGDRVFMTKEPKEINRGDIIILLYPEDKTKSYIKRVVGMPGETIEIKDGKVFINGKQIEEPYLDADLISRDSMPEPVRIPDQHYFVLGDNRRNSSDSRYWGTVPRNLVYGKYWFRYWKQG